MTMNKMVLCALSLACAMSAFAAQGADAVRIESVRPDKILYMYNEDATAEIKLANLTGDLLAGTLAVTEEWDLSESKPVWSGPVNLPPATNVTVKVNWNVGTIMYGRGLRATFRQGTKAVAQGVEFYQVADPRDWFRCFLVNSGGITEQRQDPVRVRSQYPLLNWTVDPFVTYGNYDNYFVAVPSCFGDMAPTQSEWNCSQSFEFVVKAEMTANIRRRQKLGVKAGAYTIGAASGPVGYELARQRPEWFVKNNNGSFNTWGTAVNPVELAGSRMVSGWYALGADFRNMDVVKFAGQNLVDSVRMFGWDAICFDAIYSVGGNDVLSEVCVRNVREIIRGAYPDIAFFYNTGVRFVPTQTYYNAIWGRYNAVIASLQDTNVGTLMEMQGNELADPSNPWHQWRKVYDMYVLNRNDLAAISGLEDVVRCNGHLFNCGWLYWRGQLMSEKELVASRELWTAANHVGAMQLAARLHPYVGDSPGFRPACQFMTRYSALLWARGIRTLRLNPADLDVASQRPVWWKECVYRRETNGVRDTLVSLVNTPEKDTFDYKETNDPAPAVNVTVRYAAAGDPAKVRVWALQPYGYASLKKEPQAIEIKPSVKGKVVSAALPPFTYFALIVFRENVFEP